ncbi:MAG: D-glycerate dehydrogenase [Armatimonadetes bacterium]|nr:D-glycerate dehydrogenase [Armatimonadota bacterium]
MATVYVTRPLAGEALDRIAAVAEMRVWDDPDAPPSRDVLLREVQEVDGLLCLLTDTIDEAVIAAGPKLRVISNYAVGYDNIDVPAATARNIMVCNTPGVLTETTADLAWALLMAAARRIVAADGHLRSGKWKSWSPQLMLGQDIYGATLGLVGLGRIGEAVARRAHGFGMRVLYTDVAQKPEAETEHRAEFVDLETLLRTADFVSLHTPLTDETRHLIGAEQLSWMKPTAVLINTSRGPVVDQKALADALREGRIFAAGLDVFESEPIPMDDPLLELDNVILLPHIASASVATRTKMANMAADNLIAGLSGQRPTNLVNPEVMSS